MPYTMNGVGTHVCGSRGNVGYNSYDAMEWVVVFFMPVIPLKAYHTFDWAGDQYRFIPIKWSFDLVFRTFFTGWNWGLFALGCLMLVFVGFSVFDRNMKDPSLGLGFGIAAAVSFALCGLVFVILKFTGERDRDIRRILGANPHIGSVDPALLHDDLAHKIAGDPKEYYGTDTHAAAVPDLLEQEKYSQAMWAARISTAVEDRRTGEELTDMILSDPGVRKALAAVRAKPASWDQHMMSPEERRQAAMANIRKN